jgi:hypothetical protein
MKNILLILTASILFGCKETSTTAAELNTAAGQTTVPDTTVALQFINGYVKFLNNQPEGNRPCGMGCRKPSCYNQHEKRNEKII